MRCWKPGKLWPFAQLMTQLTTNMLASFEHAKTSHSYSPSKHAYCLLILSWQVNGEVIIHSRYVFVPLAQVSYLSKQVRFSEFKCTKVDKRIAQVCFITSIRSYHDNFILRVYFLQVETGEYLKCWWTSLLCTGKLCAHNCSRCQLKQRSYSKLWRIFAI